MVKRVVVGVTARGYVDGRYIGEEKDAARGGDDRGRTRRGKAGGGILPGGTKRRGANSDADNVGNTIGGKRRRGGQAQGKAGVAGPPKGQGQRQGQGKAGGQARGPGRGRNAAGRGGQAAGVPILPGDAQARPQGRRRGPGAGPAGQGVAQGQGTAQGRNQKRGRRGGQGGAGPQLGGVSGLLHGTPQGQPRAPAPRNNRGGKKTPFRAPPMSASPSEVTDFRRVGDEVKSGQFAEALASQANVKRERLHKVLAQSGHGSRRDMEIMISSGRVMVNGIVATTGSQVSPGDSVMVDQRPVKLKFDEELPRILLYHKPEGEIVTTSDPGNRITVFDNLPKVENGKWVAIGRLDINTSGLLIFTTNGELANRLMHPRYEVEREYAVRVLGELTEEQTHNLLSGVNIDADEESDEPSVPARFDTIEARGGEGVNHWYAVTIKEGRNREVRKMFETQGLTVSRLIRTRFGKIELPPRLARGKLMELDPGQVNNVLGWVGMKADAAPAGQAVPSAKKARQPRAPRGGAEAHAAPERGNELGPEIDVHAMDAADDIGNAIAMADPVHLEHPDHAEHSEQPAYVPHVEGNERGGQGRGNERGGSERGGRGLRGRGGRGRGGERGRRPGTPAIAADGLPNMPLDSAVNASPEFDGNRDAAGVAPGAVPGTERKRNPKNRRRSRRGPRSAGAQAVNLPGNSTPPGDTSGNGGGNDGEGG
jgi:23S rRNA pseudouridine2605 synthase